MKIVLQKLSIVALGLASLAIARPAFADITTVTATFGSSSSPLSAPITVDSSQFALFNPNLGTLDSVTVVLTQYGTVSSSVNNQSATVSNDTYSVYSYDSVIATGLDGKLQGSSVISNTVSGTIATQTLLTNLGQVTNFHADSNPVNAVDISKYIGTGLATMKVTGSTTTVGMKTGGDDNPYLSFGTTATFYGSIAVYYDYTPVGVPEPASVGMVGAGLGSIAVVRRLRRRGRSRVA